MKNLDPLSSGCPDKFCELNGPCIESNRQCKTRYSNKKKMQC